MQTVAKFLTQTVNATRVGWHHIQSIFTLDSIDDSARCFAWFMVNNADILGKRRVLANFNCVLLGNTVETISIVVFITAAFETAVGVLFELNYSVHFKVNSY